MDCVRCRIGVTNLPGFRPAWSVTKPGALAANQLIGPASAPESLNRLGVGIVPSGRP